MQPTNHHITIHLATGENARAQKAVPLRSTARLRLPPAQSQTLEATVCIVRTT